MEGSGQPGPQGAATVLDIWPVFRGGESTFLLRSSSKQFLSLGLACAPTRTVTSLTQESALREHIHQRTLLPDGIASLMHAQ